MKKSVVLVLDCGATNIRAIAVDINGEIVARAAVANASEAAPENPAWQQWSLDSILQRFACCCQQLQPVLVNKQIEAICVTTFGADGALTDAQGNLLYPVISWKCPRTIAIMEQLPRSLDLKALQRLSGVGKFSFNTLYKLLWLKQQHADIMKRAHCWLFISSLINQRLTGVFTTDLTMAGTSQLMDLQHMEFSQTILQAVGISGELFPPLVRAGERIGQLQKKMANLFALPSGIPVISCGHDTQFALFGAGAAVNQVVLSSGTWEILMMRSQQVNNELLAQYPSTTCELDSAGGLYNPGMQWLASGILEWIRGLFWHPSTAWADIVAQAAAIPAGCAGLRLQGDLFAGDGQAGWQGVTTACHGGHFYRAALEALALRLKENLHCLERVSGITASTLLLVGGGSRNNLWNQIKADTLQIPVRVLADAETTVLGAAMYGWQGAGLAESADKARQRVQYHYHDFYPAANSQNNE